MPALSKKQQKFFGIVRAIQKGEQAPTTPETAKAAADMKKSDVKKFASTKHKGLPEKKKVEEMYNDPKNDKDQKQIETKQRRANQLKKQVLMKKIQAVRSGAGSEIMASNNLEGEVIEGYGNPNVGPALKMARMIDKTKPKPKSKRAKISQYLKRREMEGDKKKYAAIGEGSLHKWFKGSKSKDGKGGWVNVVTGGTCASDEPGEGTPKCVSSSKRASMSKSERLSAARRKKKADPGQQSKSGAAKPTYVSTDSPRKKKMKEEVQLTEVKDKKGKGSGSKDACYHKVKSRYSVWPSAYASGALVKCRKVGAANWGNSSKKEEFEPTGISFQQFSEKCWKGYEKKGMKTMFGKRYPNCVKKEEVEVTEGSEKSYYLDKEAEKRGMEREARKAQNKAAAKERAAQKRRSERNQLRRQGQYGAQGKYYVTKHMEKESVERDEYGDPMGGPKISKKEVKKNLAKKEPDKQHTSDTSEGMAYGITRGSGKPSGQMAAFGKKKKENPYSLKNK